MARRLICFAGANALAGPTAISARGAKSGQRIIDVIMIHDPVSIVTGIFAELIPHDGVIVQLSGDFSDRPSLIALVEDTGQ
jgi:hypothetical protein